MSQIDSAGYSTVFKGGSWKVVNGAMIVAQGKKVGTLYMTSKSRDTTSVADSSVNSKLWHRKLGHMSEKVMNLLVSKGKLPDLKSVDVGLCEDCIYGKHKRVNLSKFARTSKAEKLQLVHSDVWGPAPVRSLRCSRYYATFIDDSTRKVWVYFLKNKFDVFATFKKWKAEVENQTGLSV